MENEKFYTDPDMTIIDLAKKLNVSTHYLSQVLNENIGKRFYDFVNGYRVELVKIDLINMI